MYLKNVEKIAKGRKKKSLLCGWMHLYIDGKKAIYAMPMPMVMVMMLIMKMSMLVEMVLTMVTVIMVSCTEFVFLMIYQIRFILVGNS